MITTLLLFSPAWITTLLNSGVLPHLRDKKIGVSNSISFLIVNTEMFLTTARMRLVTTSVLV